MEGRLKHIGIAVDKVEKVVAQFKKITGVEKVLFKKYERDGLHYNTAVIDFGGVALELIEPLIPKGMAQEHLNSFGPGVYHLALEVSDLEETISFVNDRGFETNNIRKGLHGERVCFLQQEILPRIYLEVTEKENS